MNSVQAARSRAKCAATDQARERVMATALKSSSNVRDQVSEEEWKLRVDLAAAYRLVALHGWDDLIFTHLSVRIPGPEHHFLINPYNLMFEEITASSLVKIDVNGNAVMETPYLT